MNYFTSSKNFFILKMLYWGKDILLESGTALVVLESSSLTTPTINSKQAGSMWQMGQKK
jgi:hypothetical protein